MLTLSIRTGNAAFSNDDRDGDEDGMACGAEVARILRQLADTLESQGLGNGDRGSLYDVNGNNVGDWHSR